MFGRLLKVDLSTSQVSRQDIPADFCRDYIGGSGLAARLLYGEMMPGRDALDPQSPLLFITGPLTGSLGPATGRFTICGRSPQTGLWGESNIGGFVGPELRFAGFDAVWICGRSPKPVYLWIHDGRVEIRPAGHLWGKADPFQTQEYIRQETGQPKAKIASIGLAGENGVPYALILSDHGRVAGRTGMGALMGSKNLKALAVRGTGRLTFANEPVFRDLRSAANHNLKNQNLTAVLQQTGTSGSAEYLQMLGDMPQKYWTAPSFEGADKVSGSEMAMTILEGTSACQGCVIRCGREVVIKDGNHPTPGKVKGPEYETVCSFGPQLMVDDLGVITALGNICDQLGMDSITAGNTIALAYLLFEKGLVTIKDTGGLELRWGDAAPCFKLLEQIAHKEAFGVLLAKGSLGLASYYGVPELAAHINNLEVPMHDPRAFNGQALAYLTSPRGACHNQSDVFLVVMGGTLEEIGIEMIDRFETRGKGALVARHQHWRTVCNNLVMCFFAVVSPLEVTSLLNAATGQNHDIDSLMLAGERSWNLKRAINIRLGLSRASEKLPGILLEPLPDGGQEGYIPDTAVLLEDYYAASGWDQQSGAPKAEKLAQLGLDFVLEA